MTRLNTAEYKFNLIEVLLNFNLLLLLYEKKQAYWWFREHCSFNKNQFQQTRNVQHTVQPQHCRETPNSDQHNGGVHYPAQYC